MKSADRNNIFVIETPNPHPKGGGGVKFYPASQLKVMVEAAARIATPKVEGKWASTVALQCDANFIQNKDFEYNKLRKPRHVFVKTDLKVVNKKKREELERWKKEEYDLRKKGIQRKKDPAKEAPKQVEKEEVPVDQWPDVQEKDEDAKPEQNFDEYNEEETTDEQGAPKEDAQKEEQDDNADEQNDPNEEQEGQLSEKDQEQEQQQDDQEEGTDQNKEASQLPEKLDESQVVEDVEESKVQVSMGKSQQSQVVKSRGSQLSNKSGLLYKSQVADQMREMMVDFE